MVAGIKQRLVKYILVICNGIVAIVGLALFIMAMMIRFGEGPRLYASKILEERSDQLQVDMIVLAVIGFFMFVVGAAGSIGAGCENLFCLRVFVFFVVLIFLTQLVYVVALVWNKEKIRRRVFKDIRSFVKNYDSQSDAVRTAFDDMQMKGNCCGCFSKCDYGKFGQRIPESCSKTVSQEGCCKTIWRNIKIMGKMLGFVALTIGIVEYVAVVLACMLIWFIKKTRYEVRAIAKANAKVKKTSKPQLIVYRELKPDDS